MKSSSRKGTDKISSKTASRRLLSSSKYNRPNNCHGPEIDQDATLAQLELGGN